MHKNSIIYINHIRECISRIKSYTGGMDEPSFLENPLIQDAVIRNFEIIGEATKNLSMEFRKKYPDVAWKKIAGMRDKLIHGYIGVDLWAVWGVVENILPELEVSIDEIILKENGVN